MVSIEDLWSRYETYKLDLTEHSRKLGFAAAAICWFFKSDSVTFPFLVMVALGCVVAFFLVDILQQWIGAETVKRYAETKEKELFPGQPVDVTKLVINPRRLDKWPHRLSMWKIVALLLSFGFLMAEFVVRILHVFGG